MLKTSILSVALLVGLVAGALAAEPQKKEMSMSEFAAWAKNASVIKQDGIRTLQRYRDDACPRVVEMNFREICTAGYDLVIARRQTEMTMLQVWVKAAAMEPRFQNFYFGEIATLAEFGQMNELSTKITDKLMASFPPKQK